MRPRGKHGDYEEAERADPTGRSEKVTLWKLGDQPTRLALRGHSTPVTALDMTPDGRWAMTGCWGRIVRVWDLDEGVERWALRGHGGIVSSVAISDDGRLGVSASEDSTVKVWDLSAGQPIATFTGEAWMQYVPDFAGRQGRDRAGIHGPASLSQTLRMVRPHTRLRRPRVGLYRSLPLAGQP